MDSVGSLQGASSTQEKVGEKGPLLNEELGDEIERNAGILSERFSRRKASGMSVLKEVMESVGD